MTPEMTKHYSAHASMEAKREKMKSLPSFMNFGLQNQLSAPDSQISEMRTRLKMRIDQLSQTQLEKLSSVIDNFSVIDDEE